MAEHDDPLTLREWHDEFVSEINAGLIQPMTEQQGQARQPMDVETLEKAVTVSRGLDRKFATLLLAYARRHGLHAMTIEDGLLAVEEMYLREGVKLPD